MTSGAARHFVLTGICGVPATAKALSVNITVVNPNGAGSIELYPGDAPAPPASSISFAAGQTIANNAVISLSRDGDGSITVRASITGSPGQTDFLIDASGYCQ